VISIYSFADLIAVAYHGERVLGRRLARAGAMSEAMALRQALQRAAGDGSLDELVARRRAAQAASERGKQARREASARKRDSRRDDTATDGAWQAWFDGSALPNPGRMSVGALLQSPAGRIVTLSAVAGIGDSNEAEYLALISVLEAAVDAGADRLVVRGDSDVVLRDVAGSESAAAQRPGADGEKREKGGKAGPRAGVVRLTAQRDRARELVARFDSVEWRWIPRHRNRAADALARAAHP
jgi:ribonuclease HI